MRLRFVSDLHLEFGGRDGPGAFVMPAHPDDRETVLLLAGDIDVDKHAVKLARRSARQFRAVVQIAGNHEFYKSGSPQRLPDKLADAVTDLDNVYFLELGTVDIDDVRIIGATLWSDFDRGNEVAMFDAKWKLNDFPRIRTGTPRAPYARRFSPHDARALHDKSRDFVFREVEAAHRLGLKPVVVTHHAPRLPAGPNGSLLSFAFGSDLEEQIRASRAVLWVHGHVHTSHDDYIGETRVVCNPRGYVGVELNPAFNPHAAVEV